MPQLLDWPYHFAPSTRDPATRRAILDSHGVLAAQASAVFALIAVSFLLLTRRKAGDDGKARSSSGGTRASPSSAAGPTLWNLSPLTGAREPAAHVFLVAAWATMVVGLVVWDTSDDYLHLTRSPAQIASALFALNIFLSLPFLRLPSTLSSTLLLLLGGRPLPSILSLHRLHSTLLSGLLFLHAALYLNFYVQNGLLAKRVRDMDVQLGLGMLGLLAALWLTGARRTVVVGKGGASSKQAVASARWLHVLASAALGVMLWFHVQHARRSVLLAAAVWAVGQAWRTVARPAAPSVGKREEEAGGETVKGR